jgi:glycosyltransferase involved in cell wall biosynthesis
MEPDRAEPLAAAPRFPGVAGVSLRVLHVIPSLSPKRGGPSEAIFPLVRALNDLSLRAEIATTNDDGAGVRDVPLYRLIQENGVPVRFFPRSSPPIRSLREYAWAKTFRPWLREHLRDYDLIHVHALFSYVSTTAMSVARREGFPYVSRPLGQLGRWPLRQSAGRKKLYLALVEAANLRGAAAVHFTSAMEQTEAADLRLPLRGVVIPHGIVLPALIPEAKARLRARLSLPATQKLLLFLGRLHPKKGLDLLLPAFAGLRDKSITLIVAGEGEVEVLIQKYQLESQVVRTGFVAGEEKQLLLQGADLLVLPSRHENFGLVVLEALAAGTPVLVSDRVALAPEVKKFGLGGVVSLEIGALRDALREWLFREPPPDGSKLRAFVAIYYSWPASAGALARLYLSILSETRK